MFEHDQKYRLAKATETLQGKVMGEERFHFPSKKLTQVNRKHQAV